MENNHNFSKKFHKDIIYNYIIKGLGILLNLVYTSLTLAYLGDTLYGQWATISSIASWANYGDFGIGNGFRNEFSKAVANNDEVLQKKLIISTSRYLATISLFIFVILSIITEVLIQTNVISKTLTIPLFITNFFFCMDLLLGISRSAAYGYQKSFLVSLSLTITCLIRIIGVIALKYSEVSLISYSIINGLGGLIGNLFLIFILFKICNVNFEKNIKYYVDKNLKSPITNLGFKFFVLQISSLILHSTDNVIINKYISSEAVAKYELITKVYNAGDNLYSIILIGLWSATTYAFAKGHIDWIKAEIKKIILFWLFFSLGVISVSYFFNDIVRIWLGNNSIYFESSLVWLFATYTIFCGFGSIFTNVTNGIGRLKVQLVGGVIGAILNVPLSIILATTFNMGIFGVKLATLICYFGSNILVPIDVIIYLNKLTRNKKEGA